MTQRSPKMPVSAGAAAAPHLAAASQREGRESIDAVILFGALLAVGTWGGRFFTPSPGRRAVPFGGDLLPSRQYVGCQGHNCSVPSRSCHSNFAVAWRGGTACLRPWAAPSLRT